MGHGNCLFCAGKSEHADWESSYGQKFTTRDIAKARAQQNIARASCIKLLAIVHKKCNRSLPAK